MHPIDPKAVRVLLFDLGGVLIDIDPARSIAHWAKAAGADPDDLHARFSIGDAYRCHERGEITESAFFQALQAQLGLALDEATMVAGWNALLGDPIPGAAEQLERAAALRPCYLFSNSNRTHRLVWAERHAALLAPLRQVFVSCDVGRRKPEPQAFRDIAELIGEPPGHILFFDDTAENVEGARRAGLQAVRVRETADIAAALDVVEGGRAPG